MHILVTNDDGPPSPHASPYVAALVAELRRRGHVVSVCLPAQQRSWIGKAHLIGQTLRPLYYRPPDESVFVSSQGDDDDAQDLGKTSRWPVGKRRLPGTTTAEEAKELGGLDADDEDWVLIDRGTPASCVQIGLQHLFASRPPIDLVLSGPNYGRNTTAAFALSSGTLGGALEAATCGRRAVALSFAFLDRNHDRDTIQEACRHSVRVVEALWRDWPVAEGGGGGEGKGEDDGKQKRNWATTEAEMATPDLYSVNVPLVRGVERNETRWTNVLQNYWGIGKSGGASTGGCFTRVESAAGDGGREGGGDWSGEEAEELLREGEGGEAELATAEMMEGGGGETGDKKRGEGSRPNRRHVHFKWAPKFHEVFKAVEEAPAGNDGWSVKNGITSVTPLKANFMHAATHLLGQEFKLSQREQSVAEAAATVETSANPTPPESSGQVLRAVDEAKPHADGPAPQSRHFHAVIAYEDAYVQPLILAALQSAFPHPGQYTLVDPTALTKGGQRPLPQSPDNPDPDPDPDDADADVLPIGALLPSASSPCLAVLPYERLPFGFAAKHPRTALVNSFRFRKALIRKHFLAATVAHWAAKHRGVGGGGGGGGAAVGRGRGDGVTTTTSGGGAASASASALAEQDPVAGAGAEHFELDYAEFLDDALVEAWGLRASLRRNETLLEEEAERKKNGVEGEEKDGDGPTARQTGKKNNDPQWWILKPAMSDRGQGIKLFGTMAQLQGIFDRWEADRPDSEGGSEDGDEEAEEGGAEAADNDGYINASHLRHFVAQPYIHPPLLLPFSHHRGAHASSSRASAAADDSPGDADGADAGPWAGRKFHIRVYALCVGGGDGATRVYVCRDMLALFAAEPYRAPWEGGLKGDGDGDQTDLAGHLTNTCLQVLSKEAGDGDGTSSSESPSPSPSREELVHAFWTLPGLPRAVKEHVFARICAVVGDLFEAAARGAMGGAHLHFEPLPNAFEPFGIDFLLDDGGFEPARFGLAAAADGGEETEEAGLGDGTQQTPDDNPTTRLPRPWLLEVNAFPDFGQTGTAPELRELVAGFWRGVFRKAVRPFFSVQPPTSSSEDLRPESSSVDDDDARPGGAARAREGRQQHDYEEDDDDDEGMVLVRRVELPSSGWGPPRTVN